MRPRELQGESIPEAAAAGMRMGKGGRKHRRPKGRRVYDIEKVTGVKWVKKKSYRYLYKLACREDVIRAAFWKMRKKKTKRKDIQMAEADLDNWVKKIQAIIINTKPADWKAEHPELALRPPNHRPVPIFEGGKYRYIYVPTMVELWIQHVIVMILEPIIYGSSYAHTYSSFPARGGLRGKQALARWIRSGKGIRNCAQCDIRHFYGHVRLSVVLDKLSERIHDRLFLYLISACMAHFTRQLPLGFYLSQWFANFILQDLDNALKSVLRVAHVIRYLDNITMADNSKKKLHAAIIYIRRYLGKIGLRMKDDWQVFRFEYIRKDGSVTGRPVSAMGWMFHRDRTTLRKNNIIHLSRVSMRLYRCRLEKKKFQLKDCRSYASLMGWVRHSDVYQWYLDRIKPLVRYKTIKKIISKHDKEAAKIERMEKRTLRRAA